jgi:isoamylase
MPILPGPEPMPGLQGLARGSSSPLGATPGPDGANFSVVARHATGVELLLFERVDDPRPSRTIRLDPVANRMYHYWHIFVPGVRPGQIYGYRVEGPFDPVAGTRLEGRATTPPPR